MKEVSRSWLELAWQSTVASQQSHGFYATCLRPPAREARRSFVHQEQEQEEDQVAAIQGPRYCVEIQVHHVSVVHYVEWNVLWERARHLSS